MNKLDWCCKFYIIEVGVDVLEAAVDTELCLMMFVKAKVVRDEMQP